MGKAVVIHYEEFSSNRHNTPLLADLFEITTKGLKNVSHKIYGNVGGENIVLSGNKPYLLVIAGTSGIGREASRKAYGSIWYDRPLEKTFKEYLIDDLLSGEVSNRWIKNTYSRGANKNDFYVKKYRMEKYAELSSSLIFSITKPVNMSTEDFNELLELYGGRENFDVRQVLIQYLEDCMDNYTTLPNYSELVSYLLRSKSYILPSPIYITNDQVPGLIHVTNSLLDCWNGDIVPELSSTSNEGDTDSCKLYSSISTLLYQITREMLDPERFIWGLRKCTKIFPEAWMSISYSTPFYHTEDLGTNSLPKVEKLSIPRFYLPDAIEATSYSIEENSNKILELYTRLDPHSIDYALLESYFYSINRICTVLNSTTYLTRELYKVVDMDLNNSVRWKGSRKEAEIYFARFIHTLKCLLKSPKVYKYLLSRGFLNMKKSSLYGSLYILGETLEKITERKSVLALPEDIKEKLGKEILFNNSSYGKSYFISLAHAYLADSTNKNGLRLLRELVEHLQITIAFDGVKNSIENGTQVTSSGHLFRVEYPEYSSMYLQNTIFSKSLLERLTKRKVDGLVQRSTLSDVYFMFESFKDLDFTEEGIPLEQHISTICYCIAVLNEVKNCVALKSEEAYFLSSTANDYLNHSKWTSLLG